MRKMSAISALNLSTTRNVADSRWLAAEAKRSTIFAEFNVDVIHYGLDIDVFKPQNKRFARVALGLPEEQPIVLFAADSVDNYRKGFDLLFAAISQMPAHQRPFTVAIGGMLIRRS